MFNVQLYMQFFIAVVQLLCEIVCGASVNKDVYIMGITQKLYGMNNSLIKPGIWGG